MRRRYSPHVTLALLLLVTPFLCAGVLPGQVTDDASSPADLDKPARLADTRTEADRDRVYAATLAALGRLHFRRQQYLSALRSYQRARRYDPDLLDTIHDIVPLAFALKRNGEATRYAVIAAEDTATDPRLLAQLGDFLVARQEIKRAEKFYTRALQFVGKSAKSQPAKSQRVNSQRVILWNKLGRLRFVAGDFKGSAAAFDQLVALLDTMLDGKPKNEEVAKLLAARQRAFTLIGEAYLQAHRWDDAESMFRRAERAATSKKPARLAFYLARVAVKRQDWTAARRHWDEYWKAPVATGSPAPYELLRTLLRHEMPDDGAARKRAIAVLDRRLQDAPNDVVLADFVARMHVEGGQLEKARAIYLQVSRTDPGQQILAGLARIALEQSKTEQSKTEQALDALGQLVGTHQSLQAVAAELKELIEDRPRRDAFLKRALSLGKSDRLSRGAALAAGRVAVRAERFDAARTLFETALRSEGTDDAQILMAWAMSLLSARQYDRSATIFRRAIQKDALADRAGEAYFFQAGALAMADRTDDALRAAKRAVALNPDSAEYRSRVAWIHYEAKQDEAAERVYRDVIDRWDKDSSEETRDAIRGARMALSNLCLRQGRVDDSVEWIEQVLDEFPEYPGALNDLGYLWVDRKLHLERSLRMIQQAVAAEPDNRSYRDSLGWAYHRLERNQEALRELRLAIGDADTDGVILDHLGDVYWELGRRKRALDAWRRAVAAFERDDENELGRAVETKLRKRDNR